MTRVQPPGIIGLEPDFNPGDQGSNALTPMDPPGPLGIHHTIRTPLGRQIFPDQDDLDSDHVAQDNQDDEDLTHLNLLDRVAGEICDRYRQMSSEEAQIVSIDIEQYQYLFDLTHERVAGIVGYSWPQTASRDASRMSGFLGRKKTRKHKQQLEARGHSDADVQRMSDKSAMSWTERFEKLEGAAYDRGHFISLKQGGVYDMNLFPQLRSVNQSGSALGNAWREIEMYCVANPGTFCFVRPFYTDETWVPSEVEYGYLRDGTMTKRIFPNRP